MLVLMMPFVKTAILKIVPFPIALFLKLIYLIVTFSTVHLKMRIYLLEKQIIWCIPNVSKFDPILVRLFQLFDLFSQYPYRLKPIF